MTIKEAKEAFLNHTSVFLHYDEFGFYSGHIVNIYCRSNEVFDVTFQDDMQFLNDGHGIEVRGKSSLETRLMTREQAAKVLEKQQMED